MEVSVEYVIFLGQHQLFFDNDVFVKFGFVCNSLYNKLSEILRRGLFHGDDGVAAWLGRDEGRRQQYWALCQAIFYQNSYLKKKLVDMAMAEGLIRIEPVVKHAARGRGLS